MNNYISEHPGFQNLMKTINWIFCVAQQLNLGLDHLIAVFPDHIQLYIHISGKRPLND